MKTKKVFVSPYDSGWKTDFEDISREIQSTVGDLAIAIEHIGSTAVEGLPAKPIIDIDIVIESQNFLDETILRLKGAGYIHEGNLGIEGREAFKYSGKEHLRKHHLYVCPKGSVELRRHITFRDYLRNNPDSAKEYGAIKEKAAKLFPDDIDKYIEYKSGYIRELYKKCGLE